MEVQINEEPLGIEKNRRLMEKEIQGTSIAFVDFIPINRVDSSVA